VFDELGVLPAVRKFREQHRASAFGTAAIPLYSGPFGAFTVDDRSRAVAELGYLYRGRAAVFGRVDDRGAGSWNASAAPIPNLFVGAQGGTGQRPSVNGRVQAGPVWVLTTYVPDSPVQVAGLVRLGRVQTFASREFGMVTISPWSQLTVQLARRWADHSTAGRISFGPTFASPFTFPVSSLSH